jgi:hypothetical protein
VSIGKNIVLVLWELYIWYTTVLERNFEFTAPNQITKFYWSWAGALVLIVKTVHRDGSSYFKMGPLHKATSVRLWQSNYSCNQLRLQREIAQFTCAVNNFSDMLENWTNY